MSVCESNVSVCMWGLCVCVCMLVCKRFFSFAICLQTEFVSTTPSF